MATEPTELGDRSYAEALRIAEAHLIRQGWKFGPADVGRVAREILNGLSLPTKDPDNANS
jgi:hypothetical protein